MIFHEKFVWKGSPGVVVSFGNIKDHPYEAVLLKGSPRATVSKPKVHLV